MTTAVPAASIEASSGLAGRVAVVTGSTSGIGLGIAEAFGQAGMRVVVCGRAVARDLAGVRAEVEKNGLKPALYSAADMSKPADVRELVAKVEAEVGPIDVLVNNAGIQHVAPIEEFPPEKWDEIIAVNLSSAFHATRAVVGGMKGRKSGRIINVASAHGFVASPFKSAYVAAKHGLLGLTKTVALEVAEYGVTVNAICPGYVMTPLVEKQIPDTMRARNMTEAQVIRDVLLHAQPTKRMITVAEVGALALFLCTDAARSITGAALPIDGGWTAQ